MNIADRPIGPDHPPLIIWEIGINHGGDVEKAKDMIRACQIHGVQHAVKLQCHIPDAEMEPGHPWYRTIERCSLTEDEEAECKALAESLGLIYLSTPFSVAAVERLERIGVSAYKIGGGGAAHKPLVEAVAGTGKPVIMSRSLTAKDDFRQACELLGERAHPLWCVGAYPIWDHRQLFKWADFGQDEWHGYSDHTSGKRSADACKVAVAKGAWIVERHVKVDGDRHCPDAEVSIPLSTAADFHSEIVTTWSMARGRGEPMGDDPEVARVASFSAARDWRRGA